MTAPAPASVGEGSLESIVAEAWSTVLDCELDRMPDGEGVTGFAIAGAVSIAGPFSFMVLLEASDAAGAHVAETMLGLEPDEYSREDVLDAFGEMTNIVGGGVKALVDQPSALGLPSVTEGQRLHTVIPGASVISRVTFLGPFGPVRATIWQQKG